MKRTTGKEPKKAISLATLDRVAAFLLWLIEVASLIGILLLILAVPFVSVLPLLAYAFLFCALSAFSMAMQRAMTGGGVNVK